MGIDTLEKRLADAVRGDMADLYGGVLGVLGREGIQGKDEEGKAGTREVKVAIVGTYRRLNRNGRPVRDPGCESHIVSPKQAKDFGPLLRKLANSRGYGNGAFRVQIVGDGAEWIANIVRNAFPGNTVIFTNDFYHACEYLHACVELAEAACRTDVARRCKQAGMHWRHHNAAAICALTARFRSRLPAA